MTEWDEGFEAGLKYAAKESELRHNVQEWMCSQPVNDQYEGKMERANQKIQDELERFKKELRVK